jgi:hypothetical protein
MVRSGTGHYQVQDIIRYWTLSGTEHYQVLDIIKKMQGDNKKVNENLW